MCFSGYPYTIDQQGMNELDFTVYMFTFWVSMPSILELLTNVSEEPTASIFYPEDGGSKFI
jgi:hypothetical protein